MRTLLIHDVWDFGVLAHPRMPKYGVDLAQTLIHSFLVGKCRWGMAVLDVPHDHEVFAANAMEAVDGFQFLTDPEMTHLLYESIRYLHTFQDYLDTLGLNMTNPVSVYPPDRTHRRVVLLV